MGLTGLLLIICGIRASCPLITGPSLSAFKVAVVYRGEGGTDLGFEFEMARGVVDGVHTLDPAPLVINFHNIQPGSEAKSLFRMLSEGSCVDLIYLTSVSFFGDGDTVASEYPSQLFAVHAKIVPSSPNLLVYTFHAEGASMQAGLAAGLTTKTGRIGALMPFASMSDRILDPFTLGVSIVKPDAVVNKMFLNTFNGYTRSVHAVDQLVDDGCDVILIQANDNEALLHVMELGVLGIGVSSDHRLLLGSWSLTNIITKSASAFSGAVERARNGTTPYGGLIIEYGGLLENSIVYLTPVSPYAPSNISEIIRNTTLQNGDRYNCGNWVGLPIDECVSDIEDYLITNKSFSMFSSNALFHHLIVLPSASLYPVNSITSVLFEVLNCGGVEPGWDLLVTFPPEFQLTPDSFGIRQPVVHGVPQESFESTVTDHTLTLHRADSIELYPNEILLSIQNVRTPMYSGSFGPLMVQVKKGSLVMMDSSSHWNETDHLSEYLLNVNSAHLNSIHLSYPNAMAGSRSILTLVNDLTVAKPRISIIPGSKLKLSFAKGFDVSRCYAIGDVELVDSTTDTLVLAFSKASDSIHVHIHDVLMPSKADTYPIDMRLFSSDYALVAHGSSNVSVARFNTPVLLVLILLPIALVVLILIVLFFIIVHKSMKRALVEFGGEYTLLVDRHALVRAYSKRALELLGPAITRKNCSLLSVIPGTDSPELFEYPRWWHFVTTTKGKSHSALLEIVSANGSFCSMSARFFRTRILGSVWTVLALSDPTEGEIERQILKQQANLANDLARAKASLLASMSHELRTPLNGILGSIQLLLATRLNPDQLELARVANKSGKTLLDLISSILDSSRIGAGKCEVEHSQFDIVELVHDAVEIIATPARIKGLDLAFLVDERLPSLVIGSPSRLRQVLLNLGSNALKYTEEGSVMISVSPCAAPSPRSPIIQTLDQTELVVISPTQTASDIVWVEFDVKDTGRGLSRKLLDSGRMFRAYERFGREDGSEQRNPTGTGLGLALSQELANIMGGMILVESEGIGKGSVFRLRIPLEQSAPQSRVPQEALDAATEYSHRSVVIISQHPATCTVLAAHLRACGCVVAGQASSIDQGDKLCAKLKPFAIVLDLSIGTKSTFEVCQRMKRGCSRVMVTVPLGERAESPEDIQTITLPVDEKEVWGKVAWLLGATDSMPVTVTEPVDDVKQSASDDGVILIAEDQPINSMIVDNALSAAGYKVVIVEDGFEAFEYYKKAPTEGTDRILLIFMDVQMPKWDGYRATRSIRAVEKEEGRCHIPIVAMTASSLESDFEMCLASGMDGYVAKPIELDRLPGIVNKFVS